MTCLGVLGTAHIAYDAYMPVMLAIMEIPGCLVALYLVSRLRHDGMDARGNMPDEPDYDPGAKPIVSHVGEPGHHPAPSTSEMLRKSSSCRSRKWNRHMSSSATATLAEKAWVDQWQAAARGFPEHGPLPPFWRHLDRARQSAARAGGNQGGRQFFLNLFQGVLCLFLLEMGMTASRKLKDLKSGGPGFIAFGLIAPNFFATFGIVVAHAYARISGTAFRAGVVRAFRGALCRGVVYRGPGGSAPGHSRGKPDTAAGGIAGIDFFVQCDHRHSGLYRGRRAGDGGVLGVFNDVLGPVERSRRGPGCWVSHHEVAYRIPDIQRAGADGFHQHHAAGRGNRPPERNPGGPGPLQRHAHHRQRLHQRR